jgi:hypothetical protein
MWYTRVTAARAASRIRAASRAGLRSSWIACGLRILLISVPRRRLSSNAHPVVEPGHLPVVG